MAGTEILLRVRDYDLAATLDSGQAFRWQPHRDSWVGVVGQRWIRLTQRRDGIRAETAGPVADWQWLRDYLQTDVDLDAVLKTFPDDAPMRDAMAACRGLRVLRQDPWECLASFILSSTKQIVQIRQIVALLCERFGEPVCSGGLRPPETGIQPAVTDHRYNSFPTAEQLASVTESELRACKMGFRAPHLLAAARRIADGKFDLERLRHLPLVEARGELMTLRGVGGKIADCVLLFAYGFDCAFPVDVWVERALRELYFPRRRAGDRRLRHFAATHFGPHAGYAQQYLFHYMRTKMKYPGTTKMKIEAILSPAELPALAKRDLRNVTCVVFDVLRATSAFVTALHHGAKAIVPVSEIVEALALRQKQPDILLGGERDGVKIRAAQTGGVDFDLGNSPREYTPEKVRGKTIVSTTTNGTRALRACAGAQTVLAASFLNLTATAQFIRRLQPVQIVLVCAGTRENIAAEDVLAAGALGETLIRQGETPGVPKGKPAPSGPRVRQPHPNGVYELSASVETAIHAWRKAKTNLLKAVSEAENAQRLLANPELRDDVAFCLQPDVFNLVAALGGDGTIQISI